MAYSGTTTHYGLPKYVSTDKPSWLDTNDGFDAIDQALYAAAQAIDPAQIAQMQSDITALQSGKQNVLTFDATPTNGSVNPVTSGGVYTAISKNSLSPVVDIIGYNTFANAFVVPSDGYVYAVGAPCAATVYGANSTSDTDPHFSIASSTDSISLHTSIFVKKGMKIVAGATSTRVQFISLV